MENVVQNVAPSGRRSRSESIESVEINFKREFLPTIIAGWISGFGIIEYPLGHPRPYISILYASLIHGPLLILYSRDIYSNLLQAFEGNMNLLSELLHIVLPVSSIFMFCIVILHWTNQKKIKSCLRRFAEIKMEINQLKCNENDVRAFRFQKNQILILIIALLFMIFQLITNLLRTPNPLSIRNVIYLIMEVLYAFSTLNNDIMFINYVTFVKWEFVALNEKMTELFSALEEKLSMENPNDSLEENAQDYCGLIKTTRRLHLHLAKLARRMNNAYGIQIILLLITLTMFLIFYLYTIYNNVKGLINGNEFIVQSICDLIWVAVIGSRILAINLTCARTTDEAHEIRYVIMKLNIEAIDKRMELETRLLTLQLLLNPVIFTANGFFYLGHSCILLVFGIVVAYVSLLIENDNTSIDYDTLITAFINGTI